MEHWGQVQNEQRRSDDEPFVSLASDPAVNDGNMAISSIGRHQHFCMKRSITELSVTNCLVPTSLPQKVVNSINLLNLRFLCYFLFLSISKESTISVLLSPG